MHSIPRPRCRFGRLRQLPALLPASLTTYLFFKGLHPSMPGFCCPMRSLTGIPCPTCFLTRATSAALTGDLTGSVQLHAFGPVFAIVAMWWSLTSIRHGRLVPTSLRARHLAVMTLTLLAYWFLRLWLRYGMGIEGFPSFPMR